MTIWTTLRAHIKNVRKTEKNPQLSHTVSDNISTFQSHFFMCLMSDNWCLNPHHETQLKSKSTKIQSLFLTDVTNVLPSHSGIKIVAKYACYEPLSCFPPEYYWLQMCFIIQCWIPISNLQLHWYGQIKSYDAHTFTLFVGNMEYRWKVITNCIVSSSFKNRSEWNDSVPITNKRSKLAMAANFLKTRL